MDQDTTAEQMTSNEAMDAAASNSEGTNVNIDGIEKAPETPVIVGKEFTYFFKTDILRDDTGKAIGKGRKHPDVKAILPVPTSLAEVLERAAKEPKIEALVLESLNDAIFLAGRAQINAWREDNPEGDFNPTLFDLSKLSLEAIASMDRKSRGAYAPSDEELKSFCDDYTEVMLNLVQYDPKKVATHADLFKRGCIKIKTNKVALGKLKDVMAIYASRTPNMEEQEQVYEWMTARMDRWIKAEEKDYSEAI